MSAVLDVTVAIDERIAAAKTEMERLEAARSVLLGKSQTIHIDGRVLQRSEAPGRRERPDTGRRTTTVRPGERQSQVLLKIKDAPGSSTVAIARSCGIDRLQTYAIVRNLEKRGRIRGSHKDGWRIARRPVGKDPGEVWIVSELDAGKRS